VVYIDLLSAGRELGLWEGRGAQTGDADGHQSAEVSGNKVVARFGRWLIDAAQNKRPTGANLGKIGRGFDFCPDFQ